MKPEVLTLLGALAGVMVGSITTFLVTWLSKFYEEKQNKRDLVLKCAIENWKQACNYAKESGKSIKVLPLTDFIFSTSVFYDHILNKKIKAEKIEHELSRVDRIIEIIENHRIAKGSGNEI